MFLLLQVEDCDEGHWSLKEGDSPYTEDLVDGDVEDEGAGVVCYRFPLTLYVSFSSEICVFSSGRPYRHYQPQFQFSDS